jgi:hypothetical protein
MPDHSHTPQQPENDIFNSLIEQGGMTDAGIARFERHMVGVEKRLTDELSGKSPSYEDLKQLEDDLNDEWWYHDEVATVSGRVYIADEAFESIMPVEWGDPITDEVTGKQFYFVQNVKLRSHGIELFSIMNENDETVDSVAATFIFSSAEDVEDREVLSAFTKELSKHVYELPSAEEAEKRLSRQYPNELMNIRERIEGDLSGPKLLQHLKHLRNYLQSLDVVTEEFCMLATVFINDCLELDPESGYLLSIKGELSCYDGDDPSIPEDEGEWVTFEVNQAMTLTGYGTKIQANINPETNATELVVIAAVKNEEDKDTPEYISVSIDHAELFRTSNLSRSIISRALDNSSEIMPAELLQEKADLGAIEPSEPKIELAKHMLREPEAHLPQFVRDTQLLERDLGRIMNHIRMRTGVLYGSEEEARAVSLELRNAYRDRLMGAGMASGHLLKISGVTVMRPNFITNPEDSLGEYYLNEEQPLLPLSADDSFRGFAKAMIPLFEKKENEHGDVVGYKARPSLLVSYETSTSPEMSLQGVPFVSNTKTIDAFVPLDGSAEIQIVSLERFRSISNGVDSITSAYGNDPVIEYVRRLSQALFQVEFEKAGPIRNIELLSKMDGSLKRLIANGVSPEALVDALDELFKDKVVNLTIVRDGDNIQPVEDIKGTIIATTHEESIQQLVFVIETEDSELRRVALRSIVALQ